MKPYYNEIQKIFNTDIDNFYDIDDDISDYNNIIIYELEALERLSSLSLHKNLYKVNINLYYINNDDHLNNALNILNKLEAYNAKSIISMESTRMIINADELKVSKYALNFENWRTYDH